MEGITPAAVFGLAAYQQAHPETHIDAGGMPLHYYAWKPTPDLGEKSGELTHGGDEAELLAKLTAALG